MAQPSLLQLSRSSRTCFQCAHRHNLTFARYLSTSSPRGAVMGQISPTDNMSSHMRKQSSNRTRMRNLNAADIPSDVGCLPFTYVPGPIRDLLPLIKTNRKKFLQVLWYKIKYNFAGIGGSFYYLKWNKPKVDPKTGKSTKNMNPLEFSERTRIAQRLHHEMYTSLASGDYPTLSKIACTGLLSRLKIQLDARKIAHAAPNTWRIIRYNGVVPPSWVPFFLHPLIPGKAVKVVSERIAPMPFGKDSMARQIVVKIRSRQSLNRHDGKGEKVVDLTEYVVIQKMMLENQKDKGWMIWGTVEPTTSEELESLLTQNLGGAQGGLLDRAKDSMQNFTM